jgi:hypothetical protein
MSSDIFAVKMDMHCEMSTEHNFSEQAAVMSRIFAV